MRSEVENLTVNDDGKVCGWSSYDFGDFYITERAEDMWSV